MKKPDPVFRLAVLSDIHGNRWALEAVLRDIDERGISDIVNLGDCLYGPLDPAGTADILIGRAIPSVRGNEDRILLESAGEEIGSPSLGFTRDALSASHVSWLESLPKTAAACEDFYLFHGTPESDTEYLLGEVTPSGIFLRDTAELTTRLLPVDREVILCGHDHTPRTVSLLDGKLVVNPGSVGCPAYSDSSPHPHAVENGSPHARYAVLAGERGRWRVEHVALAYDWKSAASAAEKHGRHDWSEWLMTGRAVAP